MVDPKAAKFINSLVKSLQMLCHGCMDFNHNIEIIGHINLRIDNSQKFDYIVNEQVSKQGDDSTYFQSNSYHSLPPPKSSREKEKHQASSRSDDGSSIAESATNHHRLDSAAVVGSRVQIDLSGPISVSHEVESSPEHRFSISSNASNGGRRPSHSRDFSVDSEQNRLHDPLISFEDHAHNHSCSSGAAVRDKEGSERPASNSSSSERTDISSVFLGKDIEKRQQDCEGVVGQDGSIIVKAEPDDAAVEAAMEEEAEQQEHELLGIPSVSSVLPMAHQSALVANATHPSHAMFAAATLGHHGMFDSNLGAQDDSDVGRQSYVQEAFMQQILSAQKPTHLSHPGPDLDVFPLAMHRKVCGKESFLHPAPAHIQTIAKDFTKSKRLRDTENSSHFLGTAVLESSSASLSCFSGLKLESVFSGLPTQNNLLDSTDAYHKDILAGDRSYRTRTAIQNISGGESSSGELLDSLDARRLELAAKKREYNRIKQREHRARLTPEEKRLKYQRRKELEMKRKTNIM